jgi:hypothetical protein
VNKIASQILQTLSNPDSLKPVLAAAGASGLLGGYLTSQTPQRSGETPAGRRWRIMRNALLTAGAGGGAAALTAGGTKEISNALPANDVDPVVKKLTSPLARVGYGGATLGALNAKGLTGSDQAARRGGPNGLGKIISRNTQSNGQSPLIDPEDLKNLRTQGLQSDMLNNSVKGPGIRQSLERSIRDTLPGTSNVVNQKAMMDRELNLAGLNGTGAGVKERLFGLGGPALAKGSESELLSKIPGLGRTAIALLAGAYGPQLVGSSIDTGKQIAFGPQP